MADALCGPSNPLQSFKNHAQVDRTLQQDRLTGARHSPAQGFRTPDPRAGSLDAEFAAFEAGPQHLFHLHQPPLVPPQSWGPAPQSFQLRQQNADSVPAWAADFRKLRLGSAPHQPVLNNQLRPGRSVEGWQDEFIQQQKQRFSSSITNGKQAERKPIVELSYLQSEPISQYPFVRQPPGISQEQQRLLEQDFLIDGAENAAFEAAFAQAEGAVTSQLAAPQRLAKAEEVAGVRVDPILSAETRTLFQNGPTDREHQIRIGSDVIFPSDRAAMRTTEQCARDADELAHTAGQLLSSVADETSSKFGQSQFLALMRRIRDREVEVQGEEFCETNKNKNNSIFDTQWQEGRSNPSPRHEHMTAGASGASQSLVGELDEQSRRGSRPAELTRQGTREAEFGLEGVEVTSDSVRDPHALNEQKGRDERRRQIRDEFQALHPGGSAYPSAADEWVAVGDAEHGDQDRHRYDHWASGGIGAGEDERTEESPGLAGRFRSMSTADGA